MEDDGAADDFQVQSEEATPTGVKQGDIEKATTTGGSEMVPETKAPQTPVTPLNTQVSLVNGQASDTERSEVWIGGAWLPGGADLTTK